ncbi:MAG: hypothetical protein K2N23_03140 [Clostridia bacterium]|nr:hypothetical protein [Clostridia bacterium]
MTQSDALLEPLDGYNKIYKDLHLKHTEELFDQLTKKGKVDIAANKKTVAEYKAKIAEIEKVKNAISKSKALRIFLIILSVVLGIAGVVVLVSAIGGSLPLWAGIVAPILAVALIVLFIILIIKKINPKIKQNEEICIGLQAEADKLLKEAWAQMAGLNALYDWDIPQSLVTKTVPVIEMDDNFDEERFSYLHEKYGFRKNVDNTRSTQFCQSGAILGNPFLILKDLKQSWKQQLYTGSIVIHWTETVRTKEGTKTVHHSQVLSASLRRPKPVYNTDTYLVYGNEAAPNLTFSRQPSGATGMSEKQLQRHIKSKAKKLDKKSRKAVAEGDSYTRLGNDEFEALFGGTDRDNEVEYRMLFTPLAQKSLLRLIKTPEPYGDDFSMQKIKKLNYLRTKHAQGFDYEVDPVNFIHYDYEAARTNFINVNTTYFKSLYFDLAPLISIPLYQQTKTREFIYGREFASNVSCYEHESIANSFKKDLLKPEHSATPSILKTELVGKYGDADSVLITAYAFRGERRVTYIPRFGGDGRTHMVPVVWIEYIPIEKRTQMAVQKKQSSRLDFNLNSAKSEFKDMLNKYSVKMACLYERGVFAMLTGAALTKAAVSSINGVYGGIAAEAEMAAAAVDIDEEELAEIIAAEAVMHDRSNNPETDADELLKDESAETREVEASSSDEAEQSDADDDEEN